MIITKYAIARFYLRYYTYFNIVDHNIAFRKVTFRYHGFIACRSKAFDYLPVRNLAFGKVAFGNK